MYYKKFNRNDIVHNTIVTHPVYEFFINNQEVFLNRESEVAGDFSNTIKHVEQGHVSLVEMNINRPSDQLVHPFYVYDSLRENIFSELDVNDLLPGDQINGAYPMSASVSRIYYDHSSDPNNLKYMQALRNPIELSGELSSDFSYSNFSSNDVNVIAIPSIFYGSRVKKGSVKLDFYVTGALVATLEDTKKNGELINTFGPLEGQKAGIALYDYGLLLLTSSDSLHSSHTDSYGAAGSSPSWLSFGSGINEVSATSGSLHSVSDAPSYVVAFEGTNKIPTMTLMAHAEKGEFNYSNNPTFVDYDTPLTGSVSSDSYKEKVSLVKNIRKSKYENYEEEYENTTYISQVGIYDKDKNLIAVAKLANPVKKTEIQDYLLKLRLDF
jgi:hypothetical protein